MDNQNESLVFAKSLDDKLGDFRVDHETNQGSVLDVITAVTDMNPRNAPKAYSRLDPELQSKCQQLRINGKGRPTYVADAKTLIQIIWELPGKAARAFRRQCANYICRVLGGDPTLVEEMELRARHTPQEQKEFFMQGVQVPDIDRLKEEEQRLLVKRKIESDIEEQRAKTRKIEAETLELTAKSKEAELRALTAVVDLINRDGDERDSIFTRDLLKRFATERFSASPPLLTNGDSHSEHYEISIPLVAQKFGLKYKPQDASAIGKQMKQLFVKRHDKEPPKRQTYFQGRPIAENAYWSDDEDLLRASIVMHAINPDPDDVIWAHKLYRETMEDE